MDTPATYSIGQAKLVPRTPDPGLYIVSTPIGNLRDITIRALETLACADIIACEDTRLTGRLLAHYGIRGKLIPHHEHNAEKQRPRLLADLAAGKIVALVTDAGTPLISDPGYRLVDEALNLELPVIAIPGASAMLAALVSAGLPSDRFQFIGFLPPKQGARTRAIEALSEEKGTLIFYETPRRIEAVITSMAEILGSGRVVVLARELTKLHEEVIRTTLGELLSMMDTITKKGEMVVLLEPLKSVVTEEKDIDALLIERLEKMPTKKAAAEVAMLTGHKKSDLYARLLKLQSEKQS
ncbi:MAG: 16S rRNA (cytidine(1402)-2'-O)-methyltransferase [Hyphomicrobiales bacterium]|nr:MAG: 16S rRNA (cytidine(1402)-2'-O)-methyltransferase [Hyphomicrobiales bacterium]